MRQATSYATVIGPAERNVVCLRCRRENEVSLGRFTTRSGRRCPRCERRIVHGMVVQAPAKPVGYVPGW